MVKIREKIRPGMKAPWYMGFAYQAEPLDYAVAYVIPLNFIVRWALLFHRALQLPRRSWWEERFMHVRESAYQEGYRAGKHAKIDGKKIFSRSQVRRIYAQGHAKGQRDVVQRIEDDMDDRQQAREAAYQREQGREMCESHGDWLPIEQLHLTEDSVWLCDEAWDELAREAGEHGNEQSEGSDPGTS